MEEDDRYYVVKKRALPEVLWKVVEAKRLLETGRVGTINEAVDRIGLSRSSFYKYKDDILPFHENMKGKTFTYVLQMEDMPGVLSGVLKKIADYRMNLLTIHQAVPINGVATLTLSVDVLRESGDVAAMVGEIEAMEGIYYMKVLARE